MSLSSRKAMKVGKGGIMQKQPRNNRPPFHPNKTGYNVLIYGNVYWHRTLEGAEKRARDAQHYCHNIQIIELKTNRSRRWTGSASQCLRS
ncbi:MAG: hypothetical protein MUO26_00435 [Methanotrichaceae archaeon]|nr:hypothetical protein [Methanotrichaceae archaeon]